jgi:hypothetical protein
VWLEKMGTHITKVHGMSMVRFKKLYPDVPTITGNAKEQLQTARENRGLVLLFRKPRKKGGGRDKSAEEDKRYFKVGEMVEKKITSGIELTAARRLVANAMKISYSSVARYHKQFRSGVTRHGNTGMISITG